MAKIKETVARNLKYVRKCRGLTQDELDEKCDVSQAQISNIERMVYAAGIDTLENLADALRVPLVALILEDKQLLETICELDQLPCSWQVVIVPKN